MTAIQTILFVRHQQTSRLFYKQIFRQDPVLDVPGMTEFQITSTFKLGIMPNDGIAKILSTLPHPDNGTGIPRCELYIFVDDIETRHQQALDAGARLISDIAIRNWGDRVCYFADPDGHIIAFAERQ